jgi:ABC-type transport system involved in multi-copper enzyme maturation permease subunit
MPIASLVGGPVFRNEITRAARKTGWRVLGYCYAAWLLVQFVTVVSDSSPTVLPAWPVLADRYSHLGHQRAKMWARKTHAHDYLTLLLHQQLLVLLLLTPAVTAGVLGHDKERDTLGALFITKLNPWDIVAGKLFSRLTLLGGAGLAALPPLIVAAVISEVGIGRLLLAIAQAAVLTFALGAACLLCSVWTRRSGDAILACYATIILVYLGLQIVGSIFALPRWLEPLEMLDMLCRPGDTYGGEIAAHLTAWFGVGACCLVLSAWRLHPAYIRQLGWRPRRWLWAFRRPIGNDPIRWREQYVIGLTPFPWLRMVPGWMAMLGVFGFSCVVAATGLDSIYWGLGFRDAFQTGDFSRMLTILQTSSNQDRVRTEVHIMGWVLVVIGGIVVGARCSNSIADEGRRKTWDELRLLPLSLDDILISKMVGVLFATIPYLLMYALPMFAIAALNGLAGIGLVLVWLLASCLVFAGAAVVGTQFSASSERARGRGETFRIRPVEINAVVMGGWDPLPGESPGIEDAVQCEPGIRRADR